MIIDMDYTISVGFKDQIKALYPLDNFILIRTIFEAQRKKEKKTKPNKESGFCY